MKFQSPITLGDKGKANVKTVKSVIADAVPGVKVTWVPGRKALDLIKSALPTVTWEKPEADETSDEPKN